MHASDAQMELIDLQSDTLLAEHFKSVSLLDFYSSLKEENFPHMRRHAPQKILVLFGSTSVCEQTFSVMKFNKSRYRSSIADDHLSAVLHISTSDIQPDFNAQFQFLDIIRAIEDLKENNGSHQEVHRVQLKS